MSEQNPTTPTPKKSPRLRLWIILLALALGGVILWAAWPTDERRLDPITLSSADGKLRFVATKLPAPFVPPNLSPWQKLQWRFFNFINSHSTPTFTFGPSPAGLCSLNGLLNECMEVNGTHYYIAVEASAAAITFGNTNTLAGPQWVDAFERAITNSGPVMCYDFQEKHSYQDTLLLLREKPGVIKIIPRGKLAAYQQTGLASAAATNTP